MSARSSGSQSDPWPEGRPRPGEFAPSEEDCPPKPGIELTEEEAHPDPTHPLYTPYWTPAQRKSQILWQGERVVERMAAGTVYIDYHPHAGR